MIHRQLHNALPTLLLVLLGTLFSPFLTAQEAGPETIEDPNPAGILLQRDHAPEFVGGEEIIVQVAISASSNLSLFALGLYETVPDGWTFEGLYVDAGPTPDILPPQGATGVLEFGWVSPAVPVTLRYALRIPAREAGSRFITGQAEYRLESDPRRNSAPLMTQMDGVANEVPVVTLLGPALLPWSVNEAFIDPGAQAEDAEEGDLSNQIQVVGQVDVTRPGTYTLTYGVTDSANNRAVPVSRTVQVQEADTPDGTDTPSDNGSGDPEMAEPSAPSIPDGAPIPRSSNSQPNLNITVPPISLGKNGPLHDLPPGEAPAGSEENDKSALPEGERLFRGAPSLPQSATPHDGAQNALSTSPTASATPVDGETTGGLVWTSRPFLLVCVVLGILLPVVVGVVRKQSRHAPTRRRRK